jgi:predicted RNA-binding Zn ribbon-like protein
MPLLRVQAFINTRDVDQGTDLLLDADSGREWLTAAGLVALGTPIGPADLSEARAVREGLRALVRHNADGVALRPDALTALRRFAERRRPAVEIDPDGLIRLSTATESDLRAGLLGLLLTVRDAQADGTWPRLKLCANSECEWAFFDRSRNRQGSWCTMAACGNRLKNRRFRARNH